MVLNHPPSPPERSATPSIPSRVTLWHVTLVVALGLLIALTSFAAGILAERDLFAPGFARFADEIGSLNSDAEPDGAVALPLLDQTLDLIEDEYYGRPTTAEEREALRDLFERHAVAGITAGLAAATPTADLDPFLKQLEYNAIAGALATLDDDYTSFIPPVEQSHVAEQMSGEYEGIGVQIEVIEGRLTVIAPFLGSPADRAGIRPADVIEAADGQPIVGDSIDGARELIRGPAGTVVRLTIGRPGAPEPIVLDVAREAITTPAVVSQFLADGRIAWLQVSIFNDQTIPQLDTALGRAEEEDVEGIILDLRNNGGGWVRSAQEMIGRFVPTDRGPALYEDDDAAPDNDLREEPILGGGEEAFDLPLVVLVNEGTASAAEIVAGALRDHDRAQLVGAPTFGKGSVQRVHNLPDGSALRVTFARWLTPDKTPIPDDGLTPDLLVPAPSRGDVASTATDGTGIDPAAPNPPVSLPLPPYFAPPLPTVPITDLQLDRAVEEVLAAA